jgi:hypothetical protein
MIARVMQAKRRLALRRGCQQHVDIGKDVTEQPATFINALKRINVMFASHCDAVANAFGQPFADLFTVALPLVSHAARSFKIIDDFPRAH